MKRVFFVLAFFMLVSLGKTYADEGMWLPMFVERLNYTDMQEAGLQLSADEIYSVNNSSLKDAIVGLSTSPTPSGFFCTGEIVSDKGLLFTNHHCGYDIIQQHSNLEHDYLTNGFWAKSLDEELPNEELTASFLIRMEDITDSVLANVTAEMSNQERSAAIREVSSRLKKAAANDNHYNVVVKSFFNGNEYYMFVYEVFTDVRLVGAPPSAIGKFGGDTDNWMWPRHTGDFSIFRVYTAPDGSPADYAEENIPLKPKHHLPISLDGVQEDDFAMIWGYPGGTDRYLTSYGVDFNLDDQYPTIIELFGKKLEVWKSFMEADQQVKIQYASKYAVTANTWKYLIGQTRGLKKLDVADKKMETEAQFEAWVNADEARKEKYGNVLENLEESYTKMGSTIEPFLYTNFAGLSGSEIVSYANNFNGLYELLKPIDKKELPKDKDMAKKMKEERAAQVKTTAD
ncbi:MAG: S46 family peptidase, partial [Bacteroidetes bacterium]|nr:S46 family peptidase [Bacteroidota bacterium]MBU1580472.1 S46 family peptidase [Bacteroidota bacterium]